MLGKVMKRWTRPSTRSKYRYWLRRDTLVDQVTLMQETICQAIQALRRSQPPHIGITLIQEGSSTWHDATARHWNCLTHKSHLHLPHPCHRIPKLINHLPSRNAQESASDRIRFLVPLPLIHHHHLKHQGHCIPIVHPRTLPRDDVPL